MKTLVRNLDTGLLYSSPGKWTESSTRAMDFPGIEEAWRFAESLEEENLEILVMTDDGRPLWGRKIDARWALLPEA